MQPYVIKLDEVLMQNGEEKRERLVGLSGLIDFERSGLTEIDRQLQSGFEFLYVHKLLPTAHKRGLVLN